MTKSKENHELETIDWGFLRIINYRGVLVKKIHGGFIIFNRIVGSPEHVDEIIEKSLEYLGKSIKQ
jgi:type IV secretory pathway ATPase VirB11/archaellum biosynthesis ATPase